MTSCLLDLHVWTLKNQTIVADRDVGCFTYHEKTEPASPEHPYTVEKAKYTESRDVTWAPKNKRPEKQKDSIKEAEELLSQSVCLRCQWLNRRVLEVVLANGIIMTFLVSVYTGDVDRIYIDKSLNGKLSADNASDVLVTDNYLVFCYPDKPKLDYIYFMKKPETLKKIEKLSSFDMRLSQVDLVGPLGKRLERKLSCSLHEDVVLVWWTTASYEAWPWSPMTSDKERANLLLYAVNGAKMDLIAYTRTDCDPVGISYSLVHYHQIFSLEQTTVAGGELSADICIYECSRNKIQKYSTSSISVQSSVKCFGRNPMEDKVLFGCQDGTLVLYDEYKKIRKTLRTAISPHRISWHPSGLIVFVSSTKGEIQVYDVALSLINIQLVSEELPSPMATLEIGSYFRSVPVLSHMTWNQSIDQSEYKLPECCDSLFFMFEKGPVLLLQFYLGVMSQGQLSPLSLVNHYLKHRQIDEAVGILSALKWNLESQTCYACLSTIVNSLLRETLNAEREAQLEASLGSFYAPAKPLSDVTVLEYRDPMSHLARRFFHHLLRYARFEKAFLLAVDIGARDLFMDIHYLAQDKGELALAEVAKKKAQEIEADRLATQELFEEEEVGLRDSDEASDATYSSEEDYGASLPPRLPPREPIAPGDWRPLPPPPPLPTGASQSGVDTTTGGGMLSAGVAVGTTGPQKPGYINAAEMLLEKAEASTLQAQGQSVYAAVLGDESILPPPASHADQQQEPPPKQQQQKASTLKVIHFGIV